MKDPPSPLEALFFAGKSQEVLRVSIDSPEGDFDPGDAHVVVGALVFAGRQDEAAAIALELERAHTSASAGGSRRVLAAARFFLIVGECRAGRYGHAESLARKSLALLRDDDPKTRYFVQQGLGILRYFSGRIALAALHAAKARTFALESRFPYGRMLSLDLLGHSLTQTGQVHAGLAILEQGAELAEGVGLAELASTTRSAIVAYRARFGVGAEDAVATLRRHLDGIGAEDKYSRRLVLTELATIHALRGEAGRASECLERTAEVALPDGDRRARVRLEVARALAAGLREGETAAMAHLDTAARSSTGDPTLEAEVAWTEYLVCPERFSKRDPRQLRTLARTTGIARSALLADALSTGAHPSNYEGIEDAQAALVATVRDRSRPLAALFSRRLLGLLPQAFGLAPSRRIYIDEAAAQLVVEDHGELTTSELPGTSLLSLLSTLASGPQTKESLITQVWRLNVYRPERHDSVVHTAISRLRAVLGARGAWIRASEAGYTLVDGVAVVSVVGRSVEPVRRIVHERNGESEAPPPPRKPRDADKQEAILALLQSQGSVATKDVADALKTSEMTAFRLLSAMTGAGLVARVGRGRSTRYRLVP